VSVTFHVPEAVERALRPLEVWPAAGTGNCLLQALQELDHQSPAVILPSNPPFALQEGPV